jgi:flap endonuclease-1
MGIHRLMTLLREKAPGAIKEIDLKKLTGYKVACDASMSIYQFLISTQGVNKSFGLQELSDKEGNLTGHLLGMFNRSIMMLENGIRPIWVFDGKPPEMKQDLLEQRKEKKKVAEEKLDKAKEDGDDEAVKKYAGQTIRITKTMIEDAKNLVRLLGLPCVEAPSEAEAQCVELCKSGVAYGVASEDMDCLTFGTPQLLRGFNSKDDPVIEIKLEVVLKELDVTMDQFIDICILCGCDYTGSVQNLGPTKAYKYIHDYKDIEGVLKFVDGENMNEKRKAKYSYTLDDFKYDQCRKLFKTPDVLPSKDFKVIFNLFIFFTFYINIFFRSNLINQMQKN